MYIYIYIYNNIYIYIYIIYALVYRNINKRANIKQGRGKHENFPH